MRRTEAAKIIRATADEWVNEGIINWGPDSEEYDELMVGAYESDAKDLRNIAELILADETVEAAKKASYLDTVVRDLIPDNVYYWLMDEWEN